MDMGEIDNDRFERLEKQVSEMHKALVGDSYGNEGFIDRIKKLEDFQEQQKKILWIATGAAGTVSLIVNVVFQII